MSDLNFRLNIVAIITALLGFGAPSIVTAQELNTIQKSSLIGSLSQARTYGKSRLTGDGKIELTNNTSALSVKNIKEQFKDITDQKKLDSLKMSSMGGEVSGGGTTLFFGGQRRLLDVYFLKSSYMEGKLINYQSYGTKRIEHVDLKHTEVNTLIQTVIERLTGVSFKLGSALQSAYENIPFYFVSGRFHLVDTNFYLDSDLNYPSDAQVSTTAFNIKSIGVLVSRDLFLEMDEFNQASLIIHELLRFLQIHLSVQMSNADIQNLTAAIMDSESDLRGALMKSSLSFIIESSQGEDPLVARFLSLMDVAIKNYRIAPSILRGSDDAIADWYDVAEVAAQVSSNLLELYVAKKQAWSQGELLKLERLTDKFDAIVVQARSNGVRNIHAKAWGGMTELDGLFLRPKKDFITACSREREQTKACTAFYQVLNRLID